MGEDALEVLLDVVVRVALIALHLPFADRGVVATVGLQHLGRAAFPGNTGVLGAEDIVKFQGVAPLQPAHAAKEGVEPGPGVVQVPFGLVVGIAQIQREAVGHPAAACRRAHDGGPVGTGREFHFTVGLALREGGLHIDTAAEGARSVDRGTDTALQLDRVQHSGKAGNVHPENFL